MKILLVNPAFPGDQYEPHLGLLSISSMEFSKKTDVAIRDYNYIFHNEIKNYDDVCKLALSELNNADANVLGFTCNNYSLAFVYLLCKSIKNKDLKIILGGPGASFSNELLFNKLPNLDIIVRGEGELAFQMLVNSGFNPTPDIPNISFRNDNGAVIKTNSFLIDDLDSLPIIKSELHVNQDNEDFCRCFRGEKTVRIEVGRGCPYSCPFCSTSIMWGHKYRTKSVDRVVSEIMHYVHFGFQHVSLMHDNLAFSTDYMDELCSKLSKVSIEWSCSASLNCLESKMVDKMYHSGCKGIFIGLETASKDIMKEMTYKLVDDYADRLKYIISKFALVRLSYITGHPDENENSFNETLCEARKMKLMGAESVQIHPYSYRPGTTDYNRMKIEQRDLRHFEIASGVIQNSAYKEISTIVNSAPNLFACYLFIPPEKLKHLANLNILANIYHVLINIYPISLSLFRNFTNFENNILNNLLSDYLLLKCDQFIDYNILYNALLEFLDQKLSIAMDEKNKISEVLDVEKKINEMDEIANIRAFNRHSIKDYSFSRHAFIYHHKTDTFSTLVKQPGYYLYVADFAKIKIYAINRDEYMLCSYLLIPRSYADVGKYLDMNNIGEDLLKDLLHNGAITNGQEQRR